MDIFLLVVVAGLATGGVYGLIALGFVLIYKATSILNLATGAFMSSGADTSAIFITQLGFFLCIPLPLAGVMAAIAGLIVLFLIFESRGLAEIRRRIKAFFLLWPFSD